MNLSEFKIDNPVQYWIRIFNIAYWIYWGTTITMMKIGVDL